MPSHHKPHQTVTRNGYIGFCKTTCGFSEFQKWQFLLINVPTKMKMSFIRKDERDFCAVSRWPNTFKRGSSVDRFITLSGDNILNRQNFKKFLFYCILKFILLNGPPFIYF